MIANGIGAEGAKAISEMLKVNITLTSLDLSCVEEREKEKKSTKERMTDNGIGDEGAKSMSEMLKVNTTLTKLDLGGEEEIKQKKKRKMDE